MSVVSSFLRRSGGFFLRRTFGSDRLYKVVFSLYVQVLLSNGDAPMEFFVEGTRSRTAKSLHPKLGTVTDFSTCSHNPTLQHLLLLLLLSLPPLPPPPGLLSMVVEPYLMGCLPDILLLPVSISYERTVEEQLFARELLGIPKPKESTRVHCLVSFSLFLLSSSTSCSHLSLSCCAYYNFRHPSPHLPSFPPLHLFPLFPSFTYINHTCVHQGLFKARSILSERYGSIFLHLHTPLSLHAVCQSHGISRIPHSLYPK